MAQPEPRERRHPPKLRLTRRRAESTPPPVGTEQVARLPSRRAAEPAPENVVRGQGWRIIAAKEFADHILSVRFVVLLLLVGIATIAAVYTAANGISSAASQAPAGQQLFLS